MAPQRKAHRVGGTTDRLAACLAALGLLIVGCGGTGGSGGTTPADRVEFTLPVPADREVRVAAMRDIGARLYAALSEGRPQDVLLGDDELRLVLAAPAATRASALRVGLGARLGLGRSDFGPFQTSEFAGVCLQEARLEPAATPVGLVREAWVFDRVLVVGRRPGGRRVAAWVEGEFVFTNAGFGAIDLRRIEAPRVEHSDLELATCDMEVGVH